MKAGTKSQMQNVYFNILMLPLRYRVKDTVKLLVPELSTCQWSQGMASDCGHCPGSRHHNPNREHTPLMHAQRSMTSEIIHIPFIHRGITALVGA